VTNKNTTWQPISLFIAALCGIIVLPSSSLTASQTSDRGVLAVQRADDGLLQYEVHYEYIEDTWL
jgi:hypothetical protein